MTDPTDLFVTAFGAWVDKAWPLHADVHAVGLFTAAEPAPGKPPARTFVRIDLTVYSGRVHTQKAMPDARRAEDLRVHWLDHTKHLYFALAEGLDSLSAAQTLITRGAALLDDMRANCPKDEHHALVDNNDIPRACAREQDWTLRYERVISRPAALRDNRIVSPRVYTWEEIFGQWQGPKKAGSLNLAAWGASR